MARQGVLFPEETHLGLVLAVVEAEAAVAAGSDLVSWSSFSIPKLINAKVHNKMVPSAKNQKAASFRLSILLRCLLGVRSKLPVSLYLRSCRAISPYASFQPVRCD